MCRLLCLKSDKPIQITKYLEKFATTCKASKEYQGHGWGLAYRAQGTWKYQKSIQPIWEDNLEENIETDLLLVHARSAFQDEGIVVENNMPFYDEKYVFIFNGELRGVRIKAEGRIGAEKIFNYIKRFDTDGIEEALKKGTSVIEKRTRYVRAMNIMLSDGDTVYINSLFNEDHEYFQMHKTVRDGVSIVCSDPLDASEDWRTIENRTNFKL